MSFAVLYVNSCHNGFKYILEAVRSAESFKKYFPMAKFYLFTDYDINSSGVDLHVFHDVLIEKFYVPEKLKGRVHLNGQMIVKHKAMMSLSEAKVLYLGSDTYALNSDVKYIWDILDRFDMAITHAPVRINTEIGNTAILELPRCFPEMNCDVILYNNNDKVVEFIKKWSSDYLNDNFSHPHDQGTFRHCLYNSDLRFYILPPEYNYRGSDISKDIIILQNRFVLDKYIQFYRHNNNSGIKSKITSLYRKLKRGKL